MSACNTVEDASCDAQTNEEGTACVCNPGEMRACHTGPVGTENVGTCNGVPNTPPDLGGDGWNVCQNESCESALGCTAPAKVNPGAFELIANDVDDDCNPMTSDTGAPPDCSSAADFTVLTPTQLAQAIELCQFTTANPDIENRRLWIRFDVSDNIPDSNVLLAAFQWSIALPGVRPGLSPGSVALTQPHTPIERRARQREPAGSLVPGDLGILS